MTASLDPTLDFTPDSLKMLWNLFRDISFQYFIAKRKFGIDSGK